MNTPLLHWDIYEIKTESTPIQGVMLRGRLRKFYLEKVKNILLENDEAEPIVRFAVLHGEGIDDLKEYIHSLATDLTVTLVLEKVANPVLSKLKVNQEERYTI